MKGWPRADGFLHRLGLPPGELEHRSRHAARQVVGARWPEPEAELAAALVYAAGDASLAALIELRGDPVHAAVEALGAGAAVVADVRMVAAGLRRAPGRLLVAVDVPGAASLASQAGTTRTAAGIRLAWDEVESRPVAVIGNSPTALLAVLDLAAEGRPPACVIATCPGFQVAPEAKAELAVSGLPHVLVAGTRGGSGLAVAALNDLLARVAADGD